MKILLRLVHLLNHQNLKPKEGQGLFDKVRFLLFSQVKKPLRHK